MSASINRVLDVRNRELGDSKLTEAQLRRRIELHTRDGMERPRQLRADSERIALPAVDEDREAALRSIYRGASPEQQMQLATASAVLANELQAAAAQGLSSTTSLQTAMSHAAEVYMTTSHEKQVDQMTTGVMYMALDGIDQDVFGLAKELQSTLEQMKAKREDIADFRTMIAEWPAGVAEQTFTWTEFNPKTGKLEEKSGKFTKETAQAKLEELEGQLDTMRGMKEDWQLKLQDAMQKQQACVQMLSNIMKNFHDTAKSIINNLRG